MASPEWLCRISAPANNCRKTKTDQTRRDLDGSLRGQPQLARQAATAFDGQAIGQHDGQAEKRLRQNAVRHGDGGGQAEQYREAAQQALQQYGAETGETQDAQPGSLFDHWQPEGHDQREQAHGGGDQAMSVFVENAAHHLGERIAEHAVSVGGGPVRHRQPGAGAGHQPADKDQRERGKGQQLGETAQPDLTPGFGRVRWRRQIHVRTANVLHPSRSASLHQHRINGRPAR
jgi:hypothetical protein